MKLLLLSILISTNIAFAKNCERIFPENFDRSELHFTNATLSFRERTSSQINRAFFGWPEEFNFRGEFGFMNTGDGFGSCQKIDYHGEKPHYLRGYQVFQCPYFVENGYREGNQVLAYNYRAELLVWLGDINPYASNNRLIDAFDNLTESPRFQCVD